MLLACAIIAGLLLVWHVVAAPALQSPWLYTLHGVLAHGLVFRMGYHLYYGARLLWEITAAATPHACLIC